MRLLTRRDHTHQKSHGATSEERHLRRGGEEKGQTEDISIEGDTFLEVVDRD